MILNICIYFCAILLFILPILHAQEPMIEETLQEEKTYIDLPYCKIWYSTWYTNRNRDQTPLLIVHGGPGLSHRYLLELKELATDRPIIFYDQSGCDNSPLKEETAVNWTFQHFAKELEAIIDHLGLKKIRLYGYSWGAALALKYSHDHPENVEILILASPYISTHHYLKNYRKRAKSIGIYEILRKHEKENTQGSIEYKQAAAAFFKKFIYTGDPSIFGDIKINQEMSNVMWGPYETTVTGNLKDLELMPLLSSLNMPVILTSGIHDMVTPEFMQLIQKKLKKGKLFLFKHSSHMPHIEQKEDYLKVLREYSKD